MKKHDVEKGQELNICLVCNKYECITATVFVERITERAVMVKAGADKCWIPKSALKHSKNQIDAACFVSYDLQPWFNKIMDKVQIRCLYGSSERFTC